MKPNRKRLILDTAARHFSQKGFADTSLEEVASEAGVTKPAIYYHFKDKSALYEAVLLGRLTRLADTVIEATDIEATPERKLRHYIESFGDFLAANACFAAILSHEFADDGAHLPDEAARLLARTLGRVTAILEEGVEAGRFEVANPMLVQMMIVSSLITHQTTSNLRKRVAVSLDGDFRLQPDPDMHDLSVQLADHILKSVRKECP